jgi:carbamate kinase
MSKIAVVAIGGNSLIKDKEHQTVGDQYQAVAETCVHIAGLVASGYEVVVTHGNGPQVGYILLRAELASGVLHSVPLDSCDADTQGAIGYHIQRALGNEFGRRKIVKRVVTVVTQVVVSADDQAFQRPSKPIGPFYDADRAKALQRDHNWQMVEDAGRGYRRVVPSPRPIEIVEMESIRTLLKSGFVVIAVGGGGIPVIRRPNGELIGAEAVIDKDHASGLLAAEIGADLLIISTSVDCVYRDYGCPDQCSLGHLTAEQARDYLGQDQFAPGSMEPKIRAAIDYLQRVDGRVVITSPQQMVSAAAGQAGTTITR